MVLHLLFKHLFCPLFKRVSLCPDGYLFERQQLDTRGSPNLWDGSDVVWEGHRDQAGDTGQYWGNYWPIRPIIQIMLSSRHLRVKRTHSNLRKTLVRNFKCEDGCGGSVATRSITQQMAPLLWLVLTLSTLFTPHSAHIVTIPHFQTRSGLFILRVWIIRVPSHMLSSSPATNGYRVVSHWITTQYILLTSDIRPKPHITSSYHPLLMYLTFRRKWLYLVCKQQSFDVEYIVFNNNHPWL